MGILYAMSFSIIESMNYFGKNLSMLEKGLLRFQQNLYEINTKHFSKLSEVLIVIHFLTLTDFLTGFN